MLRRKFYKILIKLIVVFIIIFSGPEVFGQNPVANFTGSPLSGCSPLIVVFQDQSTGAPASWAWNFGNGNTSILQNPTASYFTPGTYTVTLTVTNINGSNTLTRSQYVSVYEPPVVDFSANNTSGCFPLRVQFSDLSTAGAGNTNVSWQWDLGNGITSTLQNPLATYTSAGFFTVTLKVTNDKGCSKTISRPNYVSVTPGVKAGFTNTQPTVCTAPADISFTNTTTGPAILSYMWDFGDGNSSLLTNPANTYNSTGSFTVTLIATSTAGCEDTIRSSVPIIIGGINTAFTSPDSVCINEVATFINNSSPTAVSGNWTFGDGGTSVSINTTHSYTTAGTYTVWLFNNYAACRDSISKNIVVNPRPVADFTAPVTSICQPPLTVNFQDISTGAVSWQWTFGDGSPASTVQNPVHTYTTYGSFTDTLITTNSFGCTDTIIKPNYIRVQRAVISIPGLPAQGCIPFPITFVPAIVSVDAVTSYKWDFGDGSPASALANPTHTYTVQGTYTVQLIITTSSGCTDTLTIPAAVKVGSNPVAGFSAAPIPVCALQPVQFTDLSVPADQWQWDFGDGITSNIQNPTHNYADTGFFSVTLIATNNGCPATMVRNNYIHVLPPIARFVSAVSNCANRLQFSFTDQSVVDPSMAPLTWSWDFGDGSPLSSVQSPVHSFPGLGIYNVTLTVTNGSCSNTISHSIQAIGQQPNFAANVITICRGTTIIFTPSNYNPAVTTSLFWDFGDGTQVTNNSPSVSYLYPNSGTYTVILVATDINGCKDTIIKNNYIRVNGPRAAYTASNLAGCTGLITTFNDLSTGDGTNAISNWQWDFGDGITQNFSGPPFQHTYNIPGTFSVKLKVTDAAGCSDSLSMNNLVTATDPVPNFVSADTLTCPGATVTFNNTSTAAGFGSQWNFGDGNTSAITSPIHSYVATGLYNIKLRIQDMYGCVDSITKNLYIRVDKPLASFTVNDSISSCSPLQVQFTNTSTFYSSLLWDFGPGQGTSTINAPMHYYVPGSYIVKLLVTSPGGCLDSAFKTIAVYDTAGSALTYLPISGCKPIAVSLNTFTPGPVVSYYWDFGDGYTQITTTPNINHLYASFGNFLPKVIMQDPSGCLLPLQGIDTILVTGATAKFGFDKNLLCDAGLVNFTDSTTFNSPVVSYNWSFGDGGTSAQQNPSHPYTTTGIYNVQLIVQTQAGCPDTLTKVNAVKVVQSPVIDITGDSVICVNSSLVHSGIFLLTDTSAVTWSWNFPNGNTSNQQNPAAQTYTTAGNFIITAIAANGSGCKDTATQNILVNPLPVVTMPGQMTEQAGFPVTIPATYSPNTISWLWSPSTGLSCTTCPAPVAGPRFNTFYQVYFTDSNNCSNIGSIEITVICKNGNLFIPNTFSPNGDGSNDIFYPRGVGLDRVRVLRVFNRWGEMVFEKTNFPVNDPSSGWDGTYKGKKPQADVYIYQAEIFCENGEIIKLNGNIALIL